MGKYVIRNGKLYSIDVRGQHPDYLAHGHKYVRRERRGDKWVYYYDEPKSLNNSKQAPRSFWGKAADAASSGWNKTRSAVSTGWNSAKTAVQTGWDTTVSEASKAAEAGRRWVDRTFNGSKNTRAQNKQAIDTKRASQTRTTTKKFPWSTPQVKDPIKNTSATRHHKWY